VGSWCTLVYTGTLVYTSVGSWCTLVYTGTLVYTSVGSWCTVKSLQGWCTPHAPLLQSSQRSAGVHHTRHRRCFNHHSAALVYTTRATACSVALVYTTCATAGGSTGVHHMRHCWWQHWCTPHAPLLVAALVYTTCVTAASHAMLLQCC
jgi:hypothetical protein